MRTLELESYSKLVAKLGLKFGLLAQGSRALFSTLPTLRKEQRHRKPYKKLENTHIIKGLGLLFAVNITPLSTEGPLVKRGVGSRW